MTIQQAYRSLKATIDRIERDGCLFYYWEMKSDILRSKEYQIISKSKSKRLMRYKMIVIDKIDKIENEYIKNRDKEQKERNDVITAIEVMTNKIKEEFDINIPAIDFNHWRSNTDVLTKHLDKICSERNKLINNK
jgi:DNA-binding PadR family transcriptional regulator